MGLENLLNAAEAAGNAGEVPFLQPLLEELGIGLSFSKAVVAGLVMGTLRANHCGVNPDNEKEVKAKLIAGICDEYSFSVADLASEYDNDLLDLLVANESAVIRETFYSEHVWPFLREHEVIPGVRLQG